MAPDLLEFLNRFNPVTQDDIDTIMSRSEIVKFNKKEIITETGNTEEYMSFILKGLAKVYFVKDSEEVIIQIIKEGGILSSSASFFSGQPSKYTVETLEPCTLLRMNKKNVEELFTSEKKWEKIGRLMTAHYFVIQEYRLLDNIRYSTQERFVRFMKENPDLFLRVPQKYLASYLNIKPETFSRLKHIMLDK
jgi:CRP-like cAMP-binding protein